MLKKSLRNSCLILLLAAVARAESFSLASQWSVPSGRPAFISREDWLAVPLPHAEMVRLKEQLEKNDKSVLQSNGETHLKVITPSEWRILKQRLTMEELEKLALKRSLMTMPYAPKCLGKVETIINNKRDYSWVVVGEAQEMRQFRREVWRLYMTKGGQGPEFQWKRWHPTVTVASTSVGFDDEIAHRDRPECLITFTAP